MNKIIKIIKKPPHLCYLQLALDQKKIFDSFFNQLWITSMAALLVQWPQNKPRNDLNSEDHISWLLFLLLYKPILKFLHLKTSFMHLKTSAFFLFLVLGWLVGKCKCLQLLTIWPNHVQQKSALVLPVLT